ncbi:S-adenosyl-L-methionine-dependent methyltransferase [Pelagophyceae sp. CCMP2097]|nr:S-adenosyl-L-methionine-dependent methyltransferase [Pelagophyceae sp. CCMP2097]
MHGAATNHEAAGDGAGVFDCDGESAYGAGVRYWEARHAADAFDGVDFDWLFEYTQLRGLLKRHVPQSATVLQLGCGNSRLAEEWANAGHTGEIRNVDYAPRLVAQLKADASRRPPLANVSYEVADVRRLSESVFPTDSFDCVFDKSTFDCIACNGADYSDDLEVMLQHAFRVLRRGGIYLLVSCGDPSTRLPWLEDEEGLDWDVSISFMSVRSRADTDGNAAADRADAAEVHVSEEVLVSGNDDWPEALRGVEEGDHTYVYICRKRPPEAHG